VRLRTRLAALGLRRHEVQRAVNTLAWADVLVWNPAGEFHPTRDWEVVLRLMVLLRAAERLGTKTVVVNHSLETSDPLLDAVIRHAYSGASLVFVRGARSYANARALGVAAERLVEAPDLVFLLAGSEPPGDSRPPAAVPPGAIVLAVNAESAPRAVDEWDALFAGLRRLGRPVVFLSNAAKLDLPASERWAARHGFAVERSQPGFRELMDAVAPAGVVVSSRLHAAILGLCRGVPVVAIEPQQFKLTEVMEQLRYPLAAEHPGVTGWADRVLGRVATALETRDELARTTAAAVERQAEDIRRAYRPLVDMLAAV
ncbi:MAG: polysaccharide pyruvyl transferase family protein, partial [Actinomycetota bacterium]|nr:polysaccharide pyruvyl transferase family protein [Actinomycetota bacterium]